VESGKARGVILFPEGLILSLGIGTAFARESPSATLRKDDVAHRMPLSMRRRGLKAAFWFHGTPKNWRQTGRISGLPTRF